MEEEFSQIKMDIGSLAEESTANENEVSNDEEATQKAPKKSVHVSQPENLTISDEIIDNSADDDKLVSPNADIFKKLTEQVKNIENEDNATVSAFTGAFKRQEQSEVRFDDTYASTSQADKSFMKAFGLGGMNTISINDRGEERTTEIETMQGDIHSDYYEYTARRQRKEIVGMYKYAKKSIKTKIIISTIVALLLFFVENIGLFAKNLSGILNINSYPYLHFAVDFVLFAICIICSYEQIYHGFKSIISTEYIPESITVVAVLAGLVHSIAMLICIPFGFLPRLYNFPIAITAVMALMFSYINVSREKLGFSVIATKDEKFVLVKNDEQDTENEQNIFTDSTGEFVGNATHVERCSFVKNYFANTNASVSLRDYLSIYYRLVLILPAIFAIISLFRHYKFPDALVVWHLGLILSLPVGVLFMYSVPFFIGNTRLSYDEVAIIGEEAISEYEKTNVISINDTTVFPSYNVKMQSLNTYNEYTVEKVLYYAASGFSAVGGPLAEVFNVATKDAIQKSKRIKYIGSGRSYLCVKVDSDVIIFADKYGMLSQGIEVGAESNESKDCTIMYIACNTKLCAKMYLKYKIDEEFLRIAKNLVKNGVCVGIKTFDPNINNDLIAAQTKLKKKDIRVIRLTSQEEIIPAKEKIDSPIVSKGLSKSVLKAIPVCKRIVKIRKVGKVLKILASIGAMVFLGFVVFKRMNFIPSVAVLGYYAIMMLIMSVVTLVLMPSKK